jgi:hypothetical protein
MKKRKLIDSSTQTIYYNENYGLQEIPATLRNPIGIPEDVWILILKFLFERELITVGKVCKVFYLIIRSKLHLVTDKIRDFGSMFKYPFESSEKFEEYLKTFNFTRIKSIRFVSAISTRFIHTLYKCFPNIEKLEYAGFLENTTEEFRYLIINGFWKLKSIYWNSTMPHYVIEKSGVTIIKNLICFECGSNEFSSDLSTICCRRRFCDKCMLLTKDTCSTDLDRICCYCINRFVKCQLCEKHIVERISMKCNKCKRTVGVKERYLGEFDCCEASRTISSWIFCSICVSGTCCIMCKECEKHFCRECCVPSKETSNKDDVGVKMICIKCADNLIFKI